MLSTELDANNESESNGQKNASSLLATSVDATGNVNFCIIFAMICHMVTYLNEKKMLPITDEDWPINCQKPNCQIPYLSVLYCQNDECQMVKCHSLRNVKSIVIFGIV